MKRAFLVAGCIVGAAVLVGKVGSFHLGIHANKKADDADKSEDDFDEDDFEDELDDNFWDDYFDELSGAVNECRAQVDALVKEQAEAEVAEVV